ncbi:MAG: ComF family protein [Candidatus Margulisbacteria bacterium]|nr:ComF family protein [Candidatus Margulisiibacteriota bacterium]
MKIMDSILDLIFPKKCHVCGALNDEPFCMKCFTKIQLLKPQAFSHSVGTYQGTLKKAIHKFKFNKKIELAQPLGYLLVKYVNRHINIAGIEMVVPVPLHARRLCERGYNQSELLCHELTKYLNVPTVGGLLYRKRETQPQFELSRVDRFRNVRGAFEVKGRKLLEGKSVLLVDDIYTTGYTTSECTRVLKQNGARFVHILTLSRAVDDRV